MSSFFDEEGDPDIEYQTEDDFSFEILRKLHPFHVEAKQINFNDKDRLDKIFKELLAEIEKGSSFRPINLPINLHEESNFQPSSSKLKINFEGHKIKTKLQNTDGDDIEQDQPPSVFMKWKKPKLDTRYSKEKETTENSEDLSLESDKSDYFHTPDPRPSKSKEKSKLVYSCLYSKLSTRKNKKWEDDGYLFVTDGQHLTLKDQEGKVVTVSNNYKFAEDVNGSYLDNGIILKVSSKEILVGDIIKEPNFY